MTTTDHDITRLLRRLVDGDVEAREELFSRVYAELLQRARSVARTRRSVIDPVALVGELYLKFFQGQFPDFNDRSHFYRCSRLAMRQIMADQARAQGRQKRNAAGERVPVTLISIGPGRKPANIVDVNDALDELATFDPTGAQIVEYRFLCGLSMKEVAAFVGEPLRSAERRWKAVRAWLSEKLR